jgi:tetratricopeptide (TPR) repeat protein
MRRGQLQEALSDLECAAGQGLEIHVLEILAEMLRAHPCQADARRLQVRLLEESGDFEGALSGLQEALDASGDSAERLGWLLRRAELRRDGGDTAGASRDLEEARSLAPDGNAFLEHVHQRRHRRLTRQLDEARGAGRVRLLLELGRRQEAEEQLSEEPAEEEWVRELRAQLLLSRGDVAAGLRVLHPGETRKLLVDAAQRCDRPEVALAGIDRLLERSEDPDLRRARRNVLQRIWERDLDPGSRVLVARIPFEPRSLDE